jgi:RNA polymerase sigma-70 factor (ECF subfamily)
VAGQNQESTQRLLAGRDTHAPAWEGNADEEELARLLKERSVAAWETLFERHFDRIYRYGLGRLSSREAAQDIAAATFARAIAAIDSYSSHGQPILAWLYGIAGNVVKETLRNEARQRRVSLVAGLLNCNNGHKQYRTPELPQFDIAAQLVSRMDLHNAMRRLTEIQREVVLLRYFAGLSAVETGHVIGRPETAVYALQARALAALRRQLEPRSVNPSVRWRRAV